MIHVLATLFGSERVLSLSSSILLSVFHYFKTKPVPLSDCLSRGFCLQHSYRTVVNSSVSRDHRLDIQWQETYFEISMVVCLTSLVIAISAMEFMRYQYLFDLGV